MKKKYLTVLLAVPFLLTGCNKPGPATETHYEADGTMISKTTYRYSGKNLVEYNSEDYYIEGKPQKSKVLNEYKDNKVIKSTCYLWDDNLKAWGETHYSYYTYDSEGNNISELVTMVGENGIVPMELFLDVYDKNNRLISEQSYDYYDGSFRASTEKAMTYNDKGLVQRENQYTSMFSEDGSLELCTYLIYSYNENDTLSKISEYSAKGVLQYETRYTYKENSTNPYEEFCVEIDGEEELVKWKDVYEYDNGGNKIKDSYYHLDDDRINLVLDSYIVFTY